MESVQQTTTIPVEGGFWKYFWKVIKEAKWLLLKGATVSFLWMVTAIFANTMDVADLTYYNAMLTIMLFVDIFGYGVSQGVIVLLSENRKPKENYLKAGFYISVAMNVLTTIVLFTAGKWILSTLLGLQQIESMTFYYLMSAFIFFYGATRFFEGALRIVDKTKQQMFANIILAVLMIVGFSLLYFTKGLLLNWIPLLFFIAYFVSFLYVAYVFKKEFKINVFKPSKIVLSKNEIEIIVRRLLMELISQAGYIFGYLFVLRNSAEIYNTYMYFENVLDVLLNIFFAFVYITSIQISRQIGNRDYKKAYKVAVYSVLISIVTWVIYALLAGCLYVPFMKGLNPELLEIGKKTYFLYVGLYFFRFLSWNLYSYVLPMGGKSISQLLLISVCASYELLLFIFAKQILSNVFLIYGLFAVECLFLTSIDLIILFKKKWMGEGEIREIVFDFDDTIYKYRSWDGWREYCQQAIIDLTGHDEGKVKDSQKLLRILKKHGVAPQRWVEYRQTHPYPFNPEGVKTISNATLKKLSRRYDLVIASNSIVDEIEKASKELKIELGYFKKIYVNELTETDTSKKPLYKKILKETRFLPNEVFVIGDSKMKDIFPAKSLGIRGFLVADKILSYKEIVNEVKKSEKENTEK